MKIRFIVGLAFVVLFSGLLNAATVNLAWDPATNYMDGSSITDSMAYKVYQGNTSRFYDVVAHVGTNQMASMTNLLTGRTYFFAATASTLDYNIESEFSEELSLYIWATNNINQTGFSLANKKVTIGWTTATGATGYFVGIGKVSGVYLQTNSYAASTRTASIVWTNGVPVYVSVGYLIGTNRSPWCVEWSVGPGMVPANTGKLRF